MGVWGGRLDYGLLAKTMMREATCQGRRLDVQRQKAVLAPGAQDLPQIWQLGPALSPGPLSLSLLRLIVPRLFNA